MESVTTDDLLKIGLKQAEIEVFDAIAAERRINRYQLICEAVELLMVRLQREQNR